MRGDEARVVDAFRTWLDDDGWQTTLDAALVDIFAVRGDERIYAEVKGRTTSPGLDVDTLYGQLLRRMPPEQAGGARFAVVVPDVALKAALRVPAQIRALLYIEVYGVSNEGVVTRAGE